MSIYKYEEAIIAKIRQITGDDRIIITPTDNMLNVIPRIDNDEIKLPLIHLIRNDWKLLNQRHFGKKMNGHINNAFPMFQTHKDENINSITGRINRLHLIPMQFTHTFEVWSRTREENDEMIRELLWFFSTLPTFEVDIPYGVDIKHNFNLVPTGEIIDNSAIANQLVTGKLFLQAIMTTCDDAYLWKSSEHNPTCISISTELKDLAERPIIGKDYNDMNIETAGQKTNTGNKYYVRSDC